MFHVARTKYKQQSEINSYIKGGQELPDFAGEVVGFFFIIIIFGWGDEDEIWVGSMPDPGSR